MRNLYNSKMTIQEATLTKDSYGSDTISWADISGLINIPCRINWLHGFARGESYINDKLFWMRDAKFYCSYYSTMNDKKKDKVTMRIVYDEINFDIVDLGNVDEKGQYMIIIVKRSEV